MPEEQQIKTRPSAKMFEDISVFLTREGGAFGMGYNPDEGEWVVRLEWGREAVDSDMVGAAAYQVHPVPAIAVELCLKEAGI